MRPTHPASAHCVQDGGRPGQAATSRACSKDAGATGLPCPAAWALGWVWASSGCFGGTPLMEDLGRGGPRIVEAQGGEGMVSRAVGEGQPPGRPGQPEPPASASAPVFLTWLGVAQGRTTCKAPGPSAGKVGVQAFATHPPSWGVGPGLLGTQLARHPRHPSLLHPRLFCPGWRRGP